MLNALLTHLEWADAMIWRSVLALAPAERDRRLLELLYHAHSVERVYLQIWRGEAPKIPELAAFRDVAAMAAWAKPYYPELRSFARGLGAAALSRRIEFPWASHIVERLGSAGDVTLEETVFQVITHTTYHRGQIATRIRELGGEPPLTDFIAWIWMNRPQPPDFGAAS